MLNQYFCNHIQYQKYMNKCLRKRWNVWFYWDSFTSKWFRMGSALCSFCVAIEYVRRVLRVILGVIMISQIKILQLVYFVTSYQTMLTSKHVIGTYTFTNVSKHVFKIHMHLLRTQRHGCHVWELPGNYCDFIVIVVFDLFCRRSKRIIVTAITVSKLIYLYSH